MSVFAGYPAPFVFDSTTREPKQQLIWGDYVTVISADGAQDGWVEVHARNYSGLMRAQDLQQERLLELNFIDVGQGDGCLIVTPDDTFLLVDAGAQDNMWWFLRWRFNLHDHPDRTMTISDGIITHPDTDHYGGLVPLLDSGQLHFTNVWHNGIIERATGPRLGPVTGTADAGFLAGVIESHEALVDLLRDDAVVGRARYPAMLRDALAGNRADHIAMASAELNYLPGYHPGDRVSVRVLSPVPVRDADGLRLPRLGDDGKTKNGNSVVLLLQYGRVRVLLGGDLNTAAERRLIEHYTADAADPAARAREMFGADIAKVCHHGSADFLDEFLACQQPAAWIVSSGDDEPYSHPRPDTLGALGKNGRGTRPLILSTELARSPAEAAKHPQQLRGSRPGAADTALAETTTTASTATAATDPKLQDAGYERAIAVYGMITVRTDGKKALISTKLEHPGTNGKQWDYYCLEPDEQDVLQPVRR